MECLYDGRRGYLCEACLADHECDEEMFMPLVNSPRTGVCGYVGNRNTDNEKLSMK